MHEWQEYRLERKIVPVTIERRCPNQHLPPPDAMFDERWGPYFDGSAFKGLPRDGVPMAHVYWPMHENWPLPINDYYSEPYDFFSPHQGKVFFLFADGSVRPVTSSADPAQVRALCTRAGGDCDSIPTWRNPTVATYADSNIRPK